MRKLTFLRPFYCDILVFDTIGENWIHRCLPQNCIAGYLDIRNQFPIILSFQFLFALIRNLFLHRRNTSGYLSLIWLSALFDDIHPKVIFTCADNNKLVSLYALSHPDVRVVYLQNALRSTNDSIPHGRYMPTYLSFGAIEKQIFQKLGFQHQDYQPVGSVKLGIALVNYKPIPTTLFDLCFISHYRPELFSKNVSMVDQQIEITQRRLFEHLVKYAYKNNLSLAVCSKTRESNLQKFEFDYFSDISGDVEFQFIKGNKSDQEFATYWAAFGSDLIIHPGSTLGFELFSAGKKVLFGANQEGGLLAAWGVELYFEALPDFVKLNTSSLDEFERTCNHIRQMPVPQFNVLAAKPARTIITMLEGEYPHNIVQKKLEQILQNVPSTT